MCDCGRPLTTCAGCAVEEYQSEHADCPTCCPKVGVAGRTGPPLDDALKIACAELAGYRDGFEGLPLNATFSTSDENLAYQLWFGKARRVRSGLVDQIDTLDRLLKQARAAVPQGGDTPPKGA